MSQKVESRFIGRLDEFEESGFARIFDIDPDNFLCGFALRWRGGIYAFENRCPHNGTPLDWTPGDVFDEKGRYLVCATHGAIFEPDTGQCVNGPCIGQRLVPVDVRIKRDQVFVEFHR